MQYPEIDPVLLDLGVLKVRWYGLMYLLGFAGGWWLGRIRARREASVLSVQQFDDLLFYLALGVILGGRLGYIFFYGFAEWLDDPLHLFRIWEGGMSFHGGLLGVLLAAFWFGRRHKLTFFQVTDFVAPLFPIGLFTGRLGNFINGELWGGPSDLPWAMQLRCQDFMHVCRDKLGLPAGTEWSPPLHPNQLYEALLEGLVMFALLWWFSSRPRPRMAISGLFLICYGVFRFGVEFVRMPDVHLGYLAFGWLTMGQLLSTPMVLAGLLMMILAYRRKA